MYGMAPARVPIRCCMAVGLVTLMNTLSPVNARCAVCRAGALGRSVANRTSFSMLTTRSSGPTVAT